MWLLSWACVVFRVAGTLGPDCSSSHLSSSSCLYFYFFFKQSPLSCKCSRLSYPHLQTQPTKQCRAGTTKTTASFLHKRWLSALWGGRGFAQCVCMWGKEGGRWDGVSVVDFRRLVFKQTAAVVQGRREGRGAIKGLTEGSVLFPHRSRRGQRWPSDSRHLLRSHWLTNMGKYDQEEFPDLFQDKVFLFLWIECTFISGNTSSQLLKYAPVFTEGYF